MEPVMATKTIRYVEASAAELRAWVAQTLNLDVPKTLNGAQIRAKVSEVQDAPDEITFDDGVALSRPDGAAPVGASRGGGMTASGSRGDPRVRLWISESEDEAGKRPVPVAVNGVQILLPRNEEFEVGYRYYHVLNNATKTTYRQDPDTQEMIPTTMHEYPFQLRGPLPSAEDLAAWAVANAHFAA
jgi:hypothetical protein